MGPSPLQNLPTVSEVFREYAAFVWRTVRYLGVREADVEDVSQEVFLVVHRKLGEFEGRSSLRTWLYGICLRVARDHQNRAHVRRETAVDELPVESQEAPQERTAIANQSRAQLVRILESLDPAKREVFVLYEIEGLTMNEIAEVTQCPLQTAYSRLNAARKVVAEFVQAGVRESGAA